MNAPPRARFILADAHVHIHACFEPNRALASAFDNFESAARDRGIGSGFAAVLLLAEGRREDWFDRASSAAGMQGRLPFGPDGAFGIRPTEERCSLTVRDGTGRVMHVIAGRQVVTGEGIEVLALITREDIGDGRSLERTVAAVREAGAIPVIPWGFGKWTGRRGRLLAGYMAGPGGRNVFLGDNGGRPGFLPFPGSRGIFPEAGLGVLPGSDPLPFPAESLKLGRSGFVIPGTLDGASPGRDLRELLTDPTTRPGPYGRPEKPGRFLRNQLAMQAWKMARRLAPSRT